MSAVMLVVENDRLRLENKRLKANIKRLEEYGHQLFLWLDRNTPVTVRNDWNKAKEAKP